MPTSARRAVKGVQLQPISRGLGGTGRLHATRGDLKACDAAYATLARLAPRATRRGRCRRSPHALGDREARCASGWRGAAGCGALRLLAEVEAEREATSRPSGCSVECLTLAPGYSDRAFSISPGSTQPAEAAPMAAAAGAPARRSSRKPLPLQARWQDLLRLLVSLSPAGLSKLQPCESGVVRLERQQRSAAAAAAAAFCWLCRSGRDRNARSL